MDLNNNERIDELGINDLKIIQNKEYFCFGTDSVLLANFVNSNSTSNVILDLCSGSGVIPVIIAAKKKCSKIFAVELQEEMFDLLDRNIKLNSLEEKIYNICDDIKNVGNIKKKILEVTKSEKVDIIVCNPPYKTVGTGLLTPNDVKSIAKCEVKCKLEDIFTTASKLLGPKGRLFMVHKPERLADLVSIARKYSLEPKNIRLVYPNIDTKASIVLIEYSKDGGNELKVLKPLIEYNVDGSYTDEMYKIYGIERK